MSRLLQRCPHGRSVRMLPKVVDTTAVVGMEAAGGATITTPTVAVEAMRREEEKGAGEEEVAEAARCREAGGMEVEGGEVVITRATIKTEEVIRVEVAEEAIEEGEGGTTKEGSRNPATMEAVEVTMTVTTKMGAGTRREAGVEEAEEEEAEEDKGVGGEGEEARILTKEDSLNSSFNMADSTTTKQALIKADTTQVEESVGHRSIVHTTLDYFSSVNKSTMPYHTILDMVRRLAKL